MRNSKALLLIVACVLLVTIAAPAQKRKYGRAGKTAAPPVVATIDTTAPSKIPRGSRATCALCAQTTILHCGPSFSRIQATFSAIALSLEASIAFTFALACSSAMTSAKLIAPIWMTARSEATGFLCSISRRARIFSAFGRMLCRHVIRPQRCWSSSCASRANCARRIDCRPSETSIVAASTSRPSVTMRT